ncbi:A-kinase anchor protein 1, mitochondrial-like isoform X2 [Antedon mediterranea]
MAQLRYTRAITCGAFVTAGLIGIYAYKKRRSKKSIDKSSERINEQDTISNAENSKPENSKQIQNDDSLGNELSAKHDTDLSEISKELNNFEFEDDFLLNNENTELVVEKIVIKENNCELANQAPEVLEPEISSSNASQQLTESIQEDTLSDEVKKDVNINGTSETLNWANEVDTIPSEIDLNSPIELHSKDKEGNHVESDQGSEVNSEGSTDSGRGSTNMPSSSTTNPDSLQTVYQFEFPTKRVGKMIGKQGRSIKNLKEKSGANIVLEKIQYNRDYQNCVIKGLPSEVDAAIQEIKIRFPDVDVHRVVESSTPSQQDAVVPVLQLCDEIVNDVLISNVISACHVFVQQPLHPSFRALPRLQSCMSSCYAQLHNTPPLPEPVDVGMICAAPINDSWCRAQIVDIHTDTDEIDVKLVDYGGYARLDQACLRQIRSDFMSLPFQALECYLAHIAPLEGEDNFSDTAASFLDELAQSYSYIEAEIVAYSEDGLPMLELYFSDQNQRKMINQVLVERGLVSWYEMAPTS